MDDSAVWTLRDWKITDNSARVDNDGWEIDG